MASMQSSMRGSGSRGLRGEGGKQSRKEIIDRGGIVVFKLGYKCGRFSARVGTRKEMLRSRNKVDGCHMVKTWITAFANGTE